MLLMMMTTQLRAQCALFEGNHSRASALIG